MKEIALVDLDGTLADFDHSMRSQLAALQPTGCLPPDIHNSKADYIVNQRRLIKSQPGFWRNLAPLVTGLEVASLLAQFFEIHILTQGPRRALNAWSEKVEWCNQWLGSWQWQMTVTQDKGLVYGRVLFDDWPPYIKRWLQHRPRGLVLMLEQPWNRDFRHPNVIPIQQGCVREMNENVLTLTSVAILKQLLRCAAKRNPSQTVDWQQEFRNACVDYGAPPDQTTLWAIHPKKLLWVEHPKKLSPERTTMSEEPQTPQALIEGIHVDVPGTELRSLLAQRAAFHRERVNHYQRLREELTNQNEQLEALNRKIQFDQQSRGTSLQSPLERVEESIRKHGDSQLYFEFSALHVATEAVYRLDRDDLRHLGILPDHHFR